MLKSKWQVPSASSSRDGDRMPSGRPEPRMEGQDRLSRTSIQQEADLDGLNVQTTRIRTSLPTQNEVINSS